MLEHPVVLNPEGRFPGLIVVDHAGTGTPEQFGSLGLEKKWHDTHHFCDLGIAPVAKELAARLDAPVILSTVSRLVIDLNRWLADPRSILASIEGVEIPGNAGMSPAQRHARHDGIFWPYHCAVARVWDRVRARSKDPLFFALHSCTRSFQGIRRPWDGGTIWNEAPQLAHEILNSLAGDAGLTLGDNQPYSGREGVYTLDRHTWGSGHRACGFEVSNDLLETPQGQRDWAERLGRALTEASHMEERA